MLQVFLTELLAAPGISVEPELRLFLELRRFDAFDCEYDKCSSIVRCADALLAAGSLNASEASKIKSVVASGDAGQVANAGQTLHLLRKGALL